MKNIFVVDDDPIFSRWSVEMLKKIDGASIHCFRSGDDFIDAMSKFDSGVVLMDLRMPGLSGIDTFARYRSQRENFPTIVISGDKDIYDAIQAMRMGVTNFLVKPFSPNDLYLAIDDCFDRLDVEQVASRTRNESSERIAALTNRESEILVLLVQGLGNRQVAERLQLSIRTVETYRARIKEKMNLQNAFELQNFAIRWLRERE